jgi:diadenosine tetraphosphate (Ap4A) HIT family hydrolase
MMQELKDKQEKSQALMEEVAKLPRNINRCVSQTPPHTHTHTHRLYSAPCTPTASWTSSPPSVCSVLLSFLFAR